MAIRRYFMNVSTRTVPALGLGARLAATDPLAHARQAPGTLLNMSCDPTRGLYAEHNAAFARYCKARADKAHFADGALFDQTYSQK